MKKIIQEGRIKPVTGKVLVVTEYIESGITIEYLARAIKNAGWPCDVATLSSGQSADFYKEPKSENYYYREELEDVNIFVGKVTGEVLFWGDDDNLAGVQKERGKIFTQPREKNRELIKIAREDAKKMVRYLKQVYEKEKDSVF